MLTALFTHCEATPGTGHPHVGSAGRVAGACQRVKAETRVRLRQNPALASGSSPPGQAVQRAMRRAGHPRVELGVQGAGGTLERSSGRQAECRTVCSR